MGEISASLIISNKKMGNVQITFLIITTYHHHKRMNNCDAYVLVAGSLRFVVFSIARKISLIDFENVKKYIILKVCMSRWK